MKSLLPHTPVQRAVPHAARGRSAARDPARGALRVGYPWTTCQLCDRPLHDLASPRAEDVVDGVTVHEPVLVVRFRSRVLIFAS